MLASDGGGEELDKDDATVVGQLVVAEDELGHERPGTHHRYELRCASRWLSFEIGANLAGVPLMETSPPSL